MLTYIYKLEEDIRELDLVVGGCELVSIYIYIDR